MRRMAVFGPGRHCDARRRASSKAAGRLCVAIRREFSPSQPWIIPNFAPLMRTAFSSMLANTGSRSPEAVEITWSTSEVAVCCSSDSQFVQQPRILDGDDSLGGEVRDQLDLLLGKWTNFLTVNGERHRSVRSPCSIGTARIVRTPPSSTAATEPGSLRSCSPDVLPCRQSETLLCAPTCDQPALPALDEVVTCLRASAKARGALCDAISCKTSPSQ